MSRSFHRVAIKQGEPRDGAS